MRNNLFVSALALVSTVAAGALEDKIRNARLAISQSSRINALEDSDFVFDFLHPPSAAESVGAGGHTVVASSSTFPGIIGSGMAMTIGFMGPCGYNTPHTHPRATEFNFAVNGTMMVGMLQENGARYIFNTVPPGSATIFPRGAIHFEMNNGCEPMIFVAGFNDEDPGALSIAQRFFGLTPEYTAASLGDFGVQEVAEIEAQIPNNIALGIDACLKKCGIDRKSVTQPTSQRQPRIATNKLPDGYNAPAPPSSAPPASNAPPAAPPAPPAAPPAAPPSYPSSSAAAIAAIGTPGSIKTQVGSFAANNGGDSGNGGNSNTPILIALLVLVALMGIGYLVLGYFFIMQMKKNNMPFTNTGRGSFRPVGEKGHYSDYSLGGAKYDPPTGRESMEYTDVQPMRTPPPPSR